MFEPMHAKHPEGAVSPPVSETSNINLGKHEPSLSIPLKNGGDLTDHESNPHAPADSDDVEETSNEITDQQYLLERIHADLSEKQRRIDDLQDDDTDYEGYGEELARIGEANDELEEAQRLLSLWPDNASLHAARQLTESAAGTLAEIKPEGLDDRISDDFSDLNLD